MKLIHELFKRFKLIEETLVPYGFSKEDNSYSFNQLIHNDEFDLRITVKDQKIDAKLIELEFNEEYTAINREVIGSFVVDLKKECERVLIDIRDKCFKKECFYFDQTNRITSLIKEKYGVEPERNMDGFGAIGIFRNPVSRKWFGLLMYNKKRNLIGNSEEKVEYINLNFKEDAELYKQDGIYHPYKKKNKSWIVVIMDESLTDQEIMNLVDISYQKSNE